MKEGDYEGCRMTSSVSALETLEGEAIEDLDPQTLAAIERAEAQAERGEGISIDQAYAKLRQKHPGL